MSKKRTEENKKMEENHYDKYSICHKFYRNSGISTTVPLHWWVVHSFLHVLCSFLHLQPQIHHVLLFLQPDDLLLLLLQQLPLLCDNLLLDGMSVFKPAARRRRRAGEVLHPLPGLVDFFSSGRRMAPGHLPRLGNNTCRIFILMDHGASRR